MQVGIGRQVDFAVTGQGRVGVDRQIGDARLLALGQPPMIGQVRIEQRVTIRIAPRAAPPPQLPTTAAPPSPASITLPHLSQHNKLLSNVFLGRC